MTWHKVERGKQKLAGNGPSPPSYRLFIHPFSFDSVLTNPLLMMHESNTAA